MEEILELLIESPSIEALKTFSYNDEHFHQLDIKRKSREVSFLKETISDVEKNRTKVYSLIDSITQKIIGIIALSASRLDDKPALLIDYIFIANIFRHPNSKTNYALPLITFALNKAFILQKEIGLSNIILYPDNESPRLISYYKKTYGFNEIQQRIPIQNKIQKEKWLYLAVKE